VKSSERYVTLNPGWYERIELDVNLPPLDQVDRFPEPGISMLVYDADSWGKKDLLGRSWINLKLEK
jgi:hypothetical protein